MINIRKIKKKEVVAIHLFSFVTITDNGPSYPQKEGVYLSHQPVFPKVERLDISLYFYF